MSSGSDSPASGGGEGVSEAGRRLSLQVLGVLVGGAHLESPLGTVDFLEAYPDILDQKFSCPSVTGCLESSGEHALSPSPPLVILGGTPYRSGGLW